MMEKFRARIGLDLAKGAISGSWGRREWKILFVRRVSDYFRVRNQSRAWIGKGSAINYFPAGLSKSLRQSGLVLGSD